MDTMKREISFIVSRVEDFQPLWESMWKTFKNLKMKQPYNPLFHSLAYTQKTEYPIPEILAQPCSLLICLQ